jgi:cyclopropane fatty-acyl-phospholipid synthase-like methyltransferase
MTALHRVAAAAEVERRVIGADYGADGYTTLAQADHLRQVLDLRPGERLLELGSGSGWPGLHLAKISGCALVMTDLPADGEPPPGEGLRQALRRATADGLRERCAVVAANGRHLPFATGIFNVVVSADVMC